MLAVTLVAPDPDALPRAVAAARSALAEIGVRVNDERPLGPGALDLPVEADLAAARTASAAALVGHAVDLCVQPAEGRRKRLLVADMDSTIIGCECVDELAAYAGVGVQVAAITEAAMRGEIAFEPALRQRVALLRGLPLATVQRCLAERVQLNPGAETLVRTMAAHGARCVLVSGGFTAFAEPMAERAGFHHSIANRLLHDGERLTGEVAEPILGRAAKLEMLLSEAALLGLNPADALAVGDGANDLDMIVAAGLGVAYRAKPMVAELADARIDHADLTALLHFQGYTTAEFQRPPGPSRR